uniref:RNase III domain-containing protein n=1 Tax=viral metagenome TaxID=1070528 RepID=A0A6C0LZR9_9ZZZZ
MEFQSFIGSLLAKANINEEHVQLYTNEKNLERYKVAFTHKSISTVAAENYETFEFDGDVIVNLCAVKYFRMRYPKITNVSWLTHIKHKVISQAILGMVAEKYGFLEHIRVGDDVINRIVYLSDGHAYRMPDGEHVKIHEPSQHHTPDDIRNALDTLHDDDGKTVKKDHKPTGCGYLALLEDTFESFIGATSAVVDSTAEVKVGASIAICFAIISAMLDEANISINYEDLWDPITRIKQMAYDRKNWPINKAFYTTDCSEETDMVNDKGEHYTSRRPQFRVTLTAWVKGDMSVSDSNRVVIGKGVGRSIQRAKHIAALQGIEYLSKIGFVEYQSNPYTKHNS